MSGSSGRPTRAAAIWGLSIRAAMLGAAAGAVVAFLFALSRWRIFWLWMPGADKGPSFGALLRGAFTKDFFWQFSQVHVPLLTFVLLMVFAGSIGGAIGFIVSRKRGKPPVAQMWTPNDSGPGR